MEEASLKKYEQRMDICKKCPDVRNSKTIGLTCGVFLLPNYVPKTCGCKLSWKCSLERQSCPQKKW